jgi:hypothetical protein
MLPFSPDGRTTPGAVEHAYEVEADSLDLEAMKLLGLTTARSKHKNG